MNKYPAPSASSPGRKKFTNDLKTYEAQPDRAKKLTALQDEAEKSTGPARPKLDEKIRRTARTDSQHE